MFQIHQLPQGSRCFLNVAKIGCLVEVLSATLLQILQKWGKGQFGFIEHKVVHLPKLIVLAGEERPSCNDFETCTLAPGNDFTRRFSLHDHRADEGAIRPGQVFFRELCHIQVH